MRYLVLLAVSLAAAASAPAEDIDALIKRAKLIFSDDFERAEDDNAKEQLGNGWVTNSKKRAQGVKQADLKDGAVVITMAKEADHSVSVKHDIPFDDGVVRVRFKMHDAKGVKFNFNDPKAKKVSWAGHISRVEVTPKSVKIQDDKTGIFDLKIREKRQSKTGKKEVAQLLKGKSKRIKVEYKTGQWYELTIVIRGAKCEAFIDGKKVGEHESPGYDHKVKQNIAFGVSGTATIDWVKVWSLD